MTTRRRFLHGIGALAGPAAVYEAMKTLGLMTTPSSVWAGPPRLVPGSGRGRNVVVLGAGVAGLMAAYELRNSGYTCRILEAQHRIGGRNLTARRGTRIVERTESRGTTEQVCGLDSGLYLNMGPARIPHHHRRVLHYCRELNVPLEVFVMSTGSNLLQTGWRPNQAIARRRVQYDLHGYIAELLTKAVNDGCVDSELSDEDSELLKELLTKFGDLTEGLYTGSTRTGCQNGPDILSKCEPASPMGFGDLLRPRYWKQSLYAPDEFEWQSTMFQPKGGMDRIIDGFRRPLQPCIQTCAEVQQIEIGEDGVTISYLDRRRQQVCRQTADYCVSTIPVPLLRELPANFRTDFLDAMSACTFAPTCKVGWQANERFWENDANQIYGGISYVDDLIRQLWYPSNDFHSKTGALLGAYNVYDRAAAMAAMDAQSRLNAARVGGARLHTEIGDHRIIPQDKGISIAWENVPFQRGGWADWSNPNSLAVMLSPDRRFFVAGDQVSTLPGWQEGAMMSAQHVVEQIAGIRPTERQQIERAPDVRRLVEGLF